MAYLKEFLLIVIVFLLIVVGYVLINILVELRVSNSIAMCDRIGQDVSCECTRTADGAGSKTFICAVTGGKQ